VCGCVLVCVCVCECECVCVTVTTQKLLLTFLLRLWLNALPAGNEREMKQGGRQDSLTMVLAMRRVLPKFFFRNLL